MNLLFTIINVILLVLMITVLVLTGVYYYKKLKGK